MHMHMPSPVKTSLVPASPPTCMSIKPQQSERIGKSSDVKRAGAMAGHQTPSPAKVSRSSTTTLGCSKWSVLPDRFKHLHKIPPVKLKATPPVVLRTDSDLNTILFNPNAGPETAKKLGIVEPDFPRIDYDRMLREWTSEERVHFMSSVQFTEHDRLSMEFDTFFPTTTQEDIDAIMDEKYGKLTTASLDETDTTITDGTRGLSEDVS
eukprot:scpid94109/ scgid15245/ 